MGRCYVCDWCNTASSFYRTGLKLNLSENRKYILVKQDGREICSHCDIELTSISKKAKDIKESEKE